MQEIQLHLQINGTFYLDNTGPDISFAPNGSTNYAKSQSSVITVSDTGKGGSAINNNSLKYVWNQDNKTTPNDSAFTGGSYTSGGAGVTASGVTGANWYLWAMATDNAGNTTKKCSGAFYLDNEKPNATAPTLTQTASDKLTLTFNQQDANSGIKKSTRISKYSTNNRFNI